MVLERGNRIGGTWRDNAYPGCRCDVESVLYSFSFAPNPDWTQTYASQVEILAYLERTATQVGLHRHLVSPCAMVSARWDDGAGVWRISTSGGPLRARVLITATGPFDQPNWLDLPGRQEFPGAIVHTARWPQSLDLTGQRVVVVGTGASAVQVVPAIQPAVARLTVVQRTPAWVPPRSNPPIDARQRERLRASPQLISRRRAMTYAAHEAIGYAFRHRATILRLGEAGALRHLARQVSDRELRRLLTPRYRMGCKRVTPSDEYYPALTRSNVELVPHAAVGFTPGGLRTADGREHEADTVVLATGFVVATPPATRAVVGRGGRSLFDVYAGHPRGYFGTTVAGFPNLFTIPGPATGQGHTSVLLYYEAQAAYVAQALAWMRRRRIRSIEVEARAQAAFNADLQRRLQQSVWVRGGCRSWYQDGTDACPRSGPAPPVRSSRRCAASIPTCTASARSDPDAPDPPVRAGGVDPAASARVPTLR